MKILRKLMDRIQEGWQKKATRRKAITVLACIVVFTTVYALIMPAITLTQKAASAMDGIGLEESAFAGELTAETEENAAFKAFVKVDEGAKIPEGTTVEVREILPDSKDYDYKLWYEKAQEAVTEDRGNNFDIRQIHLYTINLLNEGVKVEPEAPLEISFNYEKGLSIYDRSLLTAISLPVNEEGKPKDEKGKLVAPEKIMPDAEDKGTDAESITFNMSDIAMIAVAELKDISAGTLSAEGDDYSVSVQYGKDAKIPAGSVLSVNEIGQDTEEYQEYYAKAAETVSAGSLDFARFFDVTISYDGEELEPAAPVSVQISYDNPLEVLEEQEVQAIHFAAENGEETPELLNIRDKISETQGSVEKVTDITFEQESFSVIGTVLTNSSNIWEERKNWTNCAMIVTPDDKNFYAVKYDGSIVEVTMSEDKSAVTFAPFSTGETDERTLEKVQSDYLWNLNYGNANNKTTLFARQIKTTHSDFNNQIQPFNESAISNANSAWYIVRDSVGHLYHYYYDNVYTRWYLGVDTSESKITGSHGYSNATPNSISENYCKVYFAKDINIRASTESAAWPASNNKQYMILTADKQTYYAAAKDGSLTPVTIVYTDGTYKILFASDSNVTEDTLPDYQWNLTPDDSDSKKRTIASSDGTQYIWPEDAVGRTSTNMGSLSLDDQGHLYTTTSNGTQFHYLGMISGADNAKTLKGDATGTGSNSEVSTSACAVSFYDVALTDVSFASSIVEEVSDNWPSVTYSVGNVMVVKGSGDQYYAVKTDGTLTPVTVETDSSGNKTVVFDFSHIENLSTMESDYYWHIRANSDKRIIRGGQDTGNYLYPSQSTALGDDSPEWLNRDDSGHIYIYDSFDGYCYLGINTDHTKITGRNTSDNAVSVLFARNFYIRNNASGGSGSGGGSSAQNPLGAPGTNKKLTDKGDGTYEIELSVNGGVLNMEQNNKIDVIVVYDNSGSMIENRVNPNNNSSDLRLTAANGAINYLAETLLGKNYNGESRVSDKVSMSLVTFGTYAEVRQFGDLDYTFDKKAFKDEVNSITKESIESQEINQGTNWEDAFQKVKEVNTRGGNQKYVIVVSDGNPTFRLTAGEYYDDNCIYYFDPNFATANGTRTAFSTKIPEDPDGTDQSTTPAQVDDRSAAYPGVYGTGLDSKGYLSGVLAFQGRYGSSVSYNGDPYRVDSIPIYFGITAETNIQRCFDESKDDAFHLGPADKSSDSFGVTGFYAVNAFGSATRMRNIVNYVYTGNESKDYSDLNNHYIEANDQAAMESAFAKIVRQILMDYMFSNVTISDGLTNMTNAEAKLKVTEHAGDLLTESDFRYYKYGGKYDATLYADKDGYQYGTAENPTVFDPGEGHYAQYNADGTVTWNICSDGTTTNWNNINPGGTDTDGTFHLEDNVTYVLKFRVWPDQDAYDTLTSIHNAGNAARDTAYGNLSAELQSKIYKDSSGKYAARAENAEEQAVKDALQSIENAGIKAQDDAYNALDDTVKEKQIYKDADGNYRLHTNTKASVSYDVLKRTVETPEAGQTGLSIEESGTATMDNPEGMILTDTAMKVFKVWEGDLAENLPEYVTLAIYQDDQPYQTITLPNPDTDSNTWEYTLFISPALKKTDRDAAPDDNGNYPVVTLEPGHRYAVKEVESSAVYTFDGETVHPYLLDSATEVKTDGHNAQGLTARNIIRKTTIVLKKANDAEWGSADFKYLNKAHFQLLQKQISGTGTDGHPIYSYVNYSVPDDAGNPTYPYEDFEIANGETGVTITDLPAGEYKLVELSAPDGYILMDKEIYFKVTPIDSSTRLALNRYVARSGFESDTDVRSAIAAIDDAGTQAAQDAYAALEDTLKNKIVVDGYGEYVAKLEFEDDPDVLAALSGIRTARESARDTYYRDNVTDDLKTKIYVSSDVIFTTSANDGTANDTMIVKNKAGRPLPNTGGAGTTNLIIIGGMLALCSIIGFIWMNVKKRKSCDTNS